MKKIQPNAMLVSKVTHCQRVFGDGPKRSLSSSVVKLLQNKEDAKPKRGHDRVSKEVEQMIRVDHAGELGADRIYAGQMAVLGKSNYGPLIQHMWDQEKVHRATFEKIIQERRVRPTAMIPIWNVAGFVLGAGTALLGPKAAMACTVAVESVIVEHYNDQLRTLAAEPNPDTSLMETIKKFRDEEQEHHDTGLDEGAEQAPLYGFISDVIKVGCKLAISISKVV
ncbi:5-demethoxyubiquinone hydroxylase, mitochondrial isoform X2 [Hetaerina americana]|uniref:5-demethoxyubiquinone hydroxylase, mitochondrial isoform X2 n=1 Tax=Hetaerina americana TaxID=62018 RepID=UPI003A7F4D7D